MSFGGAAPPSGWLLCDGAAISRSTYSVLFGVIGTVYGPGDGSTTFNVPDLRGRVAVGYAVSGGHVDVSTLGEKDLQSAANRRPKHRTTNSLGISDPGHHHREQVMSGSGGSSSILSNPSTTTAVQANIDTQNATTGISVSGSVGTNNANDALDTPSYLVINHIIKT
jgi:microcystin-dependent protein